MSGKKKKTLSGYTTYLIWDKEKNSGWYFDKIQNDTLIVLEDNVYEPSYPSLYTFVKIK